MSIEITTQDVINASRAVSLNEVQRVEGVSLGSSSMESGSSLLGHITVDISDADIHRASKACLSLFELINSPSTSKRNINELDIIARQDVGEKKVHLIEAICNLLQKRP